MTAKQLIDKLKTEKSGLTYFYTPLGCWGGKATYTMAKCNYHHAIKFKGNHWHVVNEPYKNCFLLRCGNDQTKTIILSAINLGGNPLDYDPYFMVRKLLFPSRGV
jgi:hypothetical protein